MERQPQRAEPAPEKRPVPPKDWTFDDWAAI